VRWTTRAAVISLVAGALLSVVAATSWALVVIGDVGLLSLAGSASLAWCLALAAISLSVAIPRRPLFGVIGILGAIWMASFAIRLPASGSFWFLMPIAGVLVAALSGLAISTRLRWLGRGIALTWIVGSVAWLFGPGPTSSSISFETKGIVPIAIGWLGLLAFALWAAWFALELARGRIDDRPRTRWVFGAPTADDLRKAGVPYGSWPRRLARLASAGAALTAFALVIDRVGHRADLQADTIELAFGVAFAASAFVLGRSTPRLGANRFGWVAAVPQVGTFVGLTETGVVGGLILLVDGDLEGTPERVILMIGLGLIGTWTLRVAYRQRSTARMRGIVAGTGLLASAFVAAALDSVPVARDLAALVVAFALGVMATWLWGLAAHLEPGVARPASVFALPGIEPMPALPRVVRPAPAFQPAGTMSPTRFGVADLARRTGLTVEELQRARPVYRTVRVPKRSGGMRELQVPDAATKTIQRRLLRRLIGGVRVHPAAHGFERGRSIVSNASMHTGRRVVLRMDVIDFFGSTSARRVRRLYRVLGWDDAATEILTRLTTYGAGLPTGAPTSPRLANLVNVQLDARFAALAAGLGGAYTRYADDLTFSFDVDDRAVLADLLGATRRIAKQHGYRLHVERKLQIRRRHHRQLVTGLVVNERVALPRARRRWLRAVEHRSYRGGEATITREQLRGWHALESMVTGAGGDIGP
jgi:hypothetical protein